MFLVICLDMVTVNGLMTYHDMSILPVHTVSFFFFYRWMDRYNLTYPHIPHTLTHSPNSTTTTSTAN